MSQSQKGSLESLVSRVRIPEFADLTWMPELYQKYVQEALVFSYEMLPTFLFKPWAEHMYQFLKKQNIKSITVLGAGAGGPIFKLHRYFLSKGLRVPIKLTDLKPNPESVPISDELLTYDLGSVNAFDARATDSSNATVMIGCFHHFDQEDSRKLLKHFQAQKSQVYILEVSTRNWLNLFSNFLFLLPCTLSAPFIRPFRWSRILFSWILPLFPIMFVLDGVLSGLRTYSKDEFLGLTEPSPHYQWQITDFSFVGGLFKLRSYVGTPKALSHS